MGHATDKIELIVLGGTWSDYPREYQIWFVTELFRALNDNAVAGVAANPMLADPGVSTRERAVELLEQTDPHEVPQVVLDRRARYRDLGISTDAEAIARGVASWQ